MPSRPHAPVPSATIPISWTDSVRLRVHHRGSTYGTLVRRTVECHRPLALGAIIAEADAEPVATEAVHSPQAAQTE